MKTGDFKEDALLTQVGPGEYKISFKGIEYLPTKRPEVLGALLFGLKPKGLRFENCGQHPGVFLQIATKAGYALHLHANRKRLAAPEPIPGKTLLEIVGDAVALAPNPDAADTARALILENLGPHAFTKD